MSRGFSNSTIALAVATALSAVAAGTAPSTATAADKASGTYVAGDFHNHTTCSDGLISMQKLIKKATDRVETPWGLDWFVQAGHGGSGNRNCTLAEDESLATPAYPLVTDGNGVVLGPNTTWTNSVPPVVPKGLVSNPSTCPTGSTGACPVMWRWQSLQEYQYPLTEYLSAAMNQPLFIGVESVVAGHEHSSMSVISGQMPPRIFSRQLPDSPPYNPLGNANALAKWEYCFDRADTDTSRGNTTVGSTVGNNWDCSVPGALNQRDPDWNPDAHKLMPIDGASLGIRGHQKTVQAMKWIAARHPDQGYYVPAHLERAGPFNPESNNGYNIESLRDFNNTAPKVAFGFETQPGHGASDARGEYTIRRNNFGGTLGYVDSVGGTTYGGTGVYGAQIGGVWDALLGEGRAFWFFASSDWHNRGIFGPDDRRSSQDFYPGEYQRDYVMVKDKDGHAVSQGRDQLKPQEIVDGLRSGNSFTTSGQLIDRLAFVACEDTGNVQVQGAALAAATKNTDLSLNANCATLGEKLSIQRGSGIVVAIAVRDPQGSNYSPYTFPNPSLAQINVQQPLNSPVLDHIDVIRGYVTSGIKKPSSPNYAGQWPIDWIVNPDMARVPAAAKNATARLLRTFNSSTWNSVAGGYKVMTFRVGAVNLSQYLRLRGSNLPASVPFETDESGNPLPDLYTNNAAVTNGPGPSGSEVIPASANLKIKCTTVGTTEFDGCPSHLGTRDGQKYSSFDVAAWSDLWFYSNPIYVEVAGSQPIAGVNAKVKSQLLASVK